MIEMKTINVKLLRTSMYGKIYDIKNIMVSQQQLDALVKYKFVKVRKTKPEPVKEDIVSELKTKKKKSKK